MRNIGKNAAPVKARCAVNICLATIGPNTARGVVSGIKFPSGCSAGTGGRKFTNALVAGTYHSAIPDKYARHAFRCLTNP